MTVTIEYEAEERLEVPYEEIIRNVVEEALDYVECPYDAEVNVVLTDNEGIHQINLDMRGIDRPTDVLSFPMCDFETPGDFDGLEETPEEYFNPDTGELMLGDIVISVEKVKEQAEKFGQTVLDKFLHQIQDKCNETERKIRKVDSHIFIPYTIFSILIIILVVLFSFFASIIVVNTEILHSALIWKAVLWCTVSAVIGMVITILLSKILKRLIDR